LRRHDEPVGYPKSLLTRDGPVTVFDPLFAIHWNVDMEGI
jgi:dihydroorotase